jgi:hypothetical protein
LIKNKWVELVVSTAEQEILQAMVMVLEPFDEATGKLSGQNYVTASVILPILRGLGNSLQPVNSDNNITALFRKTMLHSFQHYTNKYGYFTNHTLITLTYLDPR